MSVTTSAPPPKVPGPMPGLSEAQAEARRAAGQGNRLPPGTGRSYGRILRENVFNFINNVLFVLGIILISLGRYLDALVSVGVVLVNTVVSLYQEVRAKRTLDRIAVLTRPKATVIRDGVPRELDPGEIVLGDLLELGPGDQIVVDGRMLDGPSAGHKRMDVDESMLTGESDALAKHPGDFLYSGSFVVSGSGMMEVEKVGSDSFANKVTAGAQAFRRIRTPLQEQVNLVVRALLLSVIYFEIVVVVKAMVDGITFVETVRMSTVVMALVPNGLILAIAVAYALGAVRMAGKGALIQQANSVESLSNVDVLCTDKTGTLTTNNIKMDTLLPLGIERLELEKDLGDFAASTAGGNRTTEAFREAFGGRTRAVAEEVLFTSALKWSALRYADAGAGGVYVLGAPEILASHLEAGSELDHQADEWTAQGLRVLLFARKEEPAGPLNGEDNAAHLPDDLAPLGLISLRDELRPMAKETLNGLASAGVKLKVISGDNPQTVAALAVQAGFPPDMRVVSGQDLAGMTPGQLADAAEDATIFGRVTPHQKEELVGALRSRGRYVAMVGDGVNDVISLKRANLAIAMQSGSQAARGVADIVLLKDSFGSLPFAFLEGQRIQNGMADILKIFMVRILSKMLIILSVLAIGGFPFSPRQASLLSFFAAGIPTLGLAAWAKVGAMPRRSLMPTLARFCLPAILLQSLMAVGIYMINFYPNEVSFLLQNPGANTAATLAHTLPQAQTATTVFAVLCGLLMVPFTAPPTKFWVGGAPLRGDWRPTILSGVLLGFFVLVLALPLGRRLFEMAPLSAVQYALIAWAAIIWGFLTRWVWRINVLDRFFGVQTQSTETGESDAGGAAAAA